MFNKWFGEDVNYIFQLKKLIQLKAEAFQLDEFSDEMDTLIQYFNDMVVPKEFNPHARTNEVLQMEINYEEMCTGMEEVHINTENLTVFQFYSKIQYFDKKSKKYENQ